MLTNGRRTVSTRILNIQRFFFFILYQRTPKFVKTTHCTLQLIMKLPTVLCYPNLHVVISQQ